MARCIKNRPGCKCSPCTGGPYYVTVSVRYGCGSLLNPGTISSVTINGVTVTVNTDGTYTSPGPGMPVVVHWTAGRYGSFVSMGVTRCGDSTVADIADLSQDYVCCAGCSVPSPKILHATIDGVAVTLTYDPVFHQWVGCYHKSRTGIKTSTQLYTGLCIESLGTISAKFDVIFRCNANPFESTTMILRYASGRFGPYGSAIVYPMEIPYTIPGDPGCYSATIVCNGTTSVPPGAIPGATGSTAVGNDPATVLPTSCDPNVWSGTVVDPDPSHDISSITWTVTD